MGEVAVVMEVVEEVVMVVKEVTVMDKVVTVAQLVVVTIAAAMEALLQLPQPMELPQPHHLTIHTEALPAHQHNLPPHTEATQHQLNNRVTTLAANKEMVNRATDSRVTVNKATAAHLNNLPLQPQLATLKDTNNQHLHTRVADLTDITS